MLRQCHRPTSWAVFFMAMAITAGSQDVSHNDLIVMITAEYDNTTTRGAGVIVGTLPERIYVVTVRHLLYRSDERADVFVEFHSFPGETHQGEILKSREDDDLVVVLVRTDGNAMIDVIDSLSFNVFVSKDSLAEREQLYKVGYVDGQKWDYTARADVLASTEGGFPVGARRADLVVESATTRPGHSGGVLLDRSDHLVGIVHQSYDDDTVATSMDSVSELLKSWNYPVKWRKVGGSDDYKFTDAEGSLALTQEEAVRTAGLVVSDEVTVDTVVEFSTPVFVLANSLRFGPEGVLKAPTIVVFAVRVVGGALDASGAPGLRGSSQAADGSPGAPGGPGFQGGSIFVASGRVDGTRIETAGGSGGMGETGKTGSAGRNGRCDGFGGWVGAADGGAGGSGGDGGRGGSGGEVILFVPDYGRHYESPRVSGGAGGAGGQGGSGGRGGSGCSGLGGIQSGHPSGPGGGSGSRGERGTDGVVRTRNIHVAEIKAALDKVGQALLDPDFGDPETLDAVRRRLLATPAPADE